MYVCRLFGGGGVWEGNVSRIYVCMVCMYVFMYPASALTRLCIIVQLCTQTPIRIIDNGHDLGCPGDCFEI